MMKCARKFGNAHQQPLPEHASVPVHPGEAPQVLLHLLDHLKPVALLLAVGGGLGEVVGGAPPATRQPGTRVGGQKKKSAKLLPDGTFKLTSVAN